MNKEINSYLSAEARRDFDEHYVRYMNEGSEELEEDNPF